MAELGIKTGLDLRNQSIEFLTRMFRKSGAYYYAIARGKDDRPVRPGRERKSYGGENTFETDTTDRAVLLDEITAIADKLWEHRERIGKDGRTVTLKIKFADFEQITRSKTPGKRSEEHTSELQSLMRISYAVFCLKKKINRQEQEQ